LAWRDPWTTIDGLGEPWKELETNKLCLSMREFWRSKPTSSEHLYAYFSQRSSSSKFSATRLSWIHLHLRLLWAVSLILNGGWSFLLPYIAKRTINPAVCNLRAISKSSHTWKDGSHSKTTPSHQYPWSKHSGGLSTSRKHCAQWKERYLRFQQRTWCRGVLN
jgi:hypothetical protein